MIHVMLMLMVTVIPLHASYHSIQASRTIVVVASLKTINVIACDDTDIIVHIYHRIRSNIDTTCSRCQIGQLQRIYLRFIHLCTRMNMVDHHVLQREVTLFVDGHSVGFAVITLHVFNLNIAQCTRRPINDESVRPCACVAILNIDVFVANVGSIILAAPLFIAQLCPIVNIVNIHVLHHNILRTIHAQTNGTFARVQLNIATAATMKYAQRRAAIEHVISHCRRHKQRVEIVPRIEYL
mmetsp:Transcript_21931/g.35253  ORF Transcript_21931/g.35253 Transcript_21931/m.35253 type:complete len:239 (-) Transcript_21931:76-792(-)